MDDAAAAFTNGGRSVLPIAGSGACDPRFSDVGKRMSQAGSHRARGPRGGELVPSPDGESAIVVVLGNRRRTCRRAVHREARLGGQASACRHRRRRHRAVGLRGERRGATAAGADLGHANVARGHGAAGRPQWPGSRGRVRSHRRPSRDVEHRPGGARLASPHWSRVHDPLRAHLSSERCCVWPRRRPRDSLGRRHREDLASRGDHPCACCSGTADSSGESGSPPTERR